MLALAAVCPARATEHVTLKNGFELDCARRVTMGDHVRLYFAEANASNESGNYLEVAADSVVRVEQIADLPNPPALAPTPAATPHSEATPTATGMREMLTHAGAAHNIDADLLASVVRAESGGQVHAVSRTGARA